MKNFAPTGRAGYIAPRHLKAIHETANRLLAACDPTQSLKGSKVLCVGLADKPDVDDDRESPTYVIMDLLKKYGAEVSYYDPYVPVIRPSREHGHWAGLKSVGWSEEEIGSHDLALILTNHSDVDHKKIAEWAPVVVDTRHVVNGEGNTYRA